MKLFTYNFLTSRAIRGVKVGFPLKLNVVKQEEVEVDYNPEFIMRLIPRLEWPAVVAASEIVGFAEGIPKELDEDYANNLELLKKLHHLLLEIDIVEGHMECPETGRKFPITDGIPNMLLNEAEV